MSSEVGHVCVVCGTEIPDHHGRFVLPMGHVHQGCKAKMKGTAVSGEGGNSFRLRRSSMLSCAPEAEALKYQWGKNFHPPDLYLQRNEGPCAQGPSHQDAANYYKMNQSAPENAAHLYQWFGDFRSPSPGCETACPVPAPVPTAPMGAEERIMRAQSQSWAGWKALRGGVSGPLSMIVYASPATSDQVRVGADEPSPSVPIAPVRYEPYLSHTHTKGPLPESSPTGAPWLTWAGSTSYLRGPGLDADGNEWMVLPWHNLTEPGTSGGRDTESDFYK